MESRRCDPPSGQGTGYFNTTQVENSAGGYWKTYSRMGIASTVHRSHSDSLSQIQVRKGKRISVSGGLLTLVLSCSILTPLTVPAVSGQTTMTNMQYSTSTLLTALYSTIQKNVTVTQSISYNQVPYGYSDQTESFSLTQIMMAGGGWRGQDYYCFYYDYFIFNAVKGHEIRGHFEAYSRPPYAVKETPVNFYILNSEQLGRFKSSSCWNVDWGWELATYASSYDLDWIAPRSGEFAFLFLSSHLPYYGTISFTARDLATSVQSTTSNYTSIQLYTLQNIQLTFSTQPSNSTKPSTGVYSALSSYYCLMALVGAIIMLGLIMLKRGMKKREFTGCKFYD